jgi:hypothetical protein
MGISKQNIFDSTADSAALDSVSSTSGHDQTSEITSEPNSPDVQNTTSSSQKHSKKISMEFAGVIQSIELPDEIHPISNPDLDTDGQAALSTKADQQEDEYVVNEDEDAFISTDEFQYLTSSSFKSTGKNRKMSVLSEFIASGSSGKPSRNIESFSFTTKSKDATNDVSSLDYMIKNVSLNAQYVVDNSLADDSNSASTQSSAHHPHSNNPSNANLISNQNVSFGHDFNDSSDDSHGVLHVSSHLKRAVAMKKRSMQEHDDRKAQESRTSIHFELTDD